MRNLDSTKKESYGFIKDRMPWLQDTSRPSTVVKTAMTLAYRKLIAAVNVHNEAQAPDCELLVLARKIRRRLENGLIIPYNSPVEMHKPGEAVSTIRARVEAHKWEEFIDQHGFWGLWGAMKFFTAVGTSYRADVQHVPVDLESVFSTIEKERPFNHIEYPVYSWAKGFSDPEGLVFYLMKSQKNKASRDFEYGLTNRSVNKLDFLINRGLLLITQEPQSWSKKSASEEEINELYKEIVNMRDSILECACRNMPLAPYIGGP